MATADNSGSTKSTSSGVDPISSAVQAGAAIANTIAGISDMNKRRRFEEALALLSNRQQDELNQKILQANTENERLEILSNSLVQYAIANDSNSAKQETVMYILAGALAAIILVSAIVYAIKKKNR